MTIHRFPWHRGLAWAAAALLLAAAPPRAAIAAPALPVETLGTAVIDGDTARVYVADIAISHIPDGRIRVYDALKGRLLGMISTGYAGAFTVSESREEVYVATTHLSRTTRGERADVLEIYDTRTLGFKHEVVLPPKRAQALNYRGLVRTTANGRFVLVQNATPATSITVVDLEQKKVAAEIETPGCWGTLPAATHPTRFSMLCGDGTVATVTLDEQGRSIDRQATQALFDADKDAWFHHAEQVGDRYWFVSFKGTLTELNLAGPRAAVVSQMKLVRTQEDRRHGWRPGGYQNFAVDPTGSWLVAAMHDKGTEGSHKSPAAKLWVFNLKAGRRVAVLPGVMAVSLTFSRNGKRLHALDVDKGALHVWAFDAGRIKRLAYVPGAGEAALHVESHD